MTLGRTRSEVRRRPRIPLSLRIRFQTLQLFDSWTLNQPTDPTLLRVAPAWIEEEPDDESSTEDDTEVLPEEQADLDSLFGGLDGSLLEDLLAV